MIAITAVLLTFIGWETVGAEGDSSGYGLIAHWAFDEDFSSSVNNDLYAGHPSQSDFVRIESLEDGTQIGSGALRLASGTRSGNGTFVDIRNPLFGQHGYDTFTIVAWYRWDDLEGDGMDSRNFVWESTPSYSLAFGLQVDKENQRDAEWWFLNRSHAAISDTSGPIVQRGVWHHVAMVWNRADGHCRFYHNGAMHNEVAFDPSTELEWMTGFHIGNHRAGDGTRDWDGWIDDMAVYDVELSGHQIQALYRRSADGRSVTAANILEAVPSPETQKLLPRPDHISPPKPEWDPSLAQGPFIGHVTTSSAIVWARIPESMSFTLSLHSDPAGAPLQSQTVQSMASQDYCLRWEMAGLKASTRYFYKIHPAGSPEDIRGEAFFDTPPDWNEPNKTTLVFGSCAGFEESGVWSQMAHQGAQGLILLGDTPYIDTVDLTLVRDAYRRFASIQGLSELIRTRPFWGTWDDHDFGRNDSDGTLPGKEFTRQGFVEYRPIANHGESGAGIYTRFRHGPVEVFLLDARWFARTEPSWANPGLPTLLGKRQWQWLKAGLLDSTAPFKILATGMIWDDKKNSESDDWGTYMHERLAIEKWLGDNRIPGVILMGGDIHVSRHLKYPESRSRAGYVLHQFITSPVHDGVIPSLNVDHPDLVWSAEEPQVFLKIEAWDDLREAVLQATWMKADGESIHEVRIPASELAPD